MMTPVRLLSSLLCALVVAPACTSSETAKQRYFENGQRYVAEQRYNEAILEFRNALRVDDKFADARVALADALAAVGDPERAYGEYIRAADLLPDDPAAQKKAATLLFMAGQYQDVRTRAEAVLQKNPGDVEARLLFANALVGLRDLEGGVREIEEALRLDPDHAPSYTNMAFLRMAQGQRTEAEAAFQKAISLDPASLKARQALAHFQLATGDLAAAEQTLNEALKIQPRDPLTNRALAAVYLVTGRVGMAEAPLKLVTEVTQSLAARLTLAEYYGRLDRVNDARAILEPMAKSPATYADAQTRLAQMAYGLGEPDRAKKMLDEVLAREPNFALALQVKARWLLIDGRPAQALERASAAVTAAPRDAGALYLQGTLQAINGQTQAAVRTFNDVLRLNPRAAAAQVQLAQLNLKDGEPAAAVGLAEEAVVNAPALPEARLVLARALVAQRDLNRAAVEIERLLRVYPRAAGVHAIKGTLHLVKGDDAGARAAFQTAFDLDPDSISALSGLTLLDAQANRFAEARKRLDARLAVQPKRVELLLMSAKIAVSEGHLPKAEETLRQIIEIAPTSAEAFVFLGEVLRAQNRLDAALAEFESAIRRNPADVPAHTMAAMIVHVQGKTGDAKRRYTRLLDLEPRASVAANNLAWIYADEQQNLDFALQLAERAAEQLPDYAEALDTLGWVYYRKQLPLLAVEPFERAIAMDPGNATFHYHLGLALVTSGDRVRGRESLQTALKLYPDFPQAKREIAALDQ